MKMTNEQIHDLALLYAEKAIGPIDHNAKNRPTALDYLFSYYLYAFEKLAEKNQEESN